MGGGRWLKITVHGISGCLFVPICYERCGAVIGMGTNKKTTPILRKINAAKHYKSKTFSSLIMLVDFVEPWFCPDGVKISRNSSVQRLWKKSEHMRETSMVAKTLTNGWTINVK